MRRGALALLIAIAACKSGEPKPAAEYRTLLERGRSMPATADRAAEYVATWTAILDMTGDEAVRTEARYNLGCAALRGKNTEVAKRRFEKAAASPKRSAWRTMSHYHLADIQTTEEDWRGALSQARAYLAQDPTNPDWIAAAHYFVGQSLARLGQTDEARRALQAFVDANDPPDRHSKAAVEASRKILLALR